MSTLQYQAGPSRQAGKKDMQYQHFIPRLILRGFAEDATHSNCGAAGIQKKKGRKDGLLQTINTHDGKLGSSFLSRHYGLTDMYRDTLAADEQEIEDKLARLETQAGNTIANARKSFLQPGATLNLTRAEKDTLRKFFFLMKYRNSSMHDRFNVATIDDYISDDKDKMSKYMREKGFTSPRQVWLANLRAFLDVDMDHERKWHATLRKHSYPDDAMLFILHAEQSYMAFCKPKSLDDEFLLTDNVFGIFEGPNSVAYNLATGDAERGLWTEWHNFAPISASLCVIFRSNYLPGGVTGTGMNRSKIYKMLLDAHDKPDQATSILQDLPVRRCDTSYASVQDNIVQFNAGYQGPSVSDRYQFECFELDATHMAKINSLFLEEAVAAQSITYKHRAAAARAIKHYLEASQPGFKLEYGENSRRSLYLKALENALHALGGTANTVRNIVSMPNFYRHPLDYSTHMSRSVVLSVASEIAEKYPRLAHDYHLLGGTLPPQAPSRQSNKRERFITLEDWSSSVKYLEDVDQSGKILFLHIKIDSALSASGLKRGEKSQYKVDRQIHFASLHPHYIWLHIKALNNLENFDKKSFEQIRPLECQGPMDEVVSSKCYKTRILPMPTKLTSSIRAQRSRAYNVVCRIAGRVEHAATRIFQG